MVSTKLPDDMSKTFIPCNVCIELRKDGPFDCHRCKGTGFVQDPSTFLCNRCGSPLCPAGTMNADIPHGLVQAEVWGGYNSTALTDLVGYEFSLCESCLVILFEGFEIPPACRDHSAGPIPYAEDRAARLRREWKDKGGPLLHRAAGLCEFGPECTNDAHWRVFYSDHLSDEGVCSDHRPVNCINAIIVPAKPLEGIYLEKCAPKSLLDAETIARVWLDAVIPSARRKQVALWRYAPVPLLQALSLTDDDAELYVCLLVPNAADVAQLEKSGKLLAPRVDRQLDCFEGFSIVFFRKNDIDFEARLVELFRPEEWWMPFFEGLGWARTSTGWYMPSRIARGLEY